MQYSFLGTWSTNYRDSNLTILTAMLLSSPWPARRAQTMKLLTIIVSFRETTSGNLVEAHIGQAYLCTQIEAFDARLSLIATKALRVASKLLQQCLVNHIVRDLVGQPVLLDSIIDILAKLITSKHRISLLATCIWRRCNRIWYSQRAHSDLTRTIIRQSMPNTGRQAKWQVVQAYRRSLQ